MCSLAIAFSRNLLIQPDVGDSLAVLIQLVNSCDYAVHQYLKIEQTAHLNVTFCPVYSDYIHYCTICHNIMMQVCIFVYANKGR